jgi:hypothetical protein
VGVSKTEGRLQVTNWIDIEGAEFEVVVYRDQTFYFGEEVVLGPDRREIGYVCTRGNQTVVAATLDGETVASKLIVGEDLADDGDLIDTICELGADSTATDPAERAADAYFFPREPGSVTAAEYADAVEAIKRGEL